MSMSRFIGKPAALSLTLGAAGFGCVPAFATPSEPGRFGAAAAPAADTSRLVVFAHGSTRDLNGDGDTHDPGETTVFFDVYVPWGPSVGGAVGLVALGPWTLLAKDPAGTEQVLLLNDLNRDGDALDPGEMQVWFPGTLPDGHQLYNYAELRRRANGSYLLQNDSWPHEFHPETIYLLDDLNADGDMDDPGEVTEFFELTPVGQIQSVGAFDLVEDNLGCVYLHNRVGSPKSIDRIDWEAGTIAEWLHEDMLLSLTEDAVELSGTYELEYNPMTDEVIFGAYKYQGPLGQCIYRAKDRTGNRLIDEPEELNLMWAENTHADGFEIGAIKDLCLLPDGRLLFAEPIDDCVYILTDTNADGDYQDAGETSKYFAYPFSSLGNWQPTTVTAVLISLADCDINGTLNVDDIDCFVAAFIAGDLPAADCDGTGTINIDDIDCFVAAFLADGP